MQLEINKIYVINLSRRKDRLQHITEECAKHGLEMIRVEAVDGSKILYRIHSKRKAAIIGCYKTHLGLLKQFNDLDNDYFFIAEDDAIFAENFKEKLSNYINELPDDWDMIYLGGNIKSKGSVAEFSSNFKKALNVFCTHAYIVRKKAISALIKKVETKQWKVDVLYTEFQKENKCFITIPELAWQKAGFSDIEQKVTENKFLQNLS